MPARINRSISLAAIAIARPQYAGAATLHYSWPDCHCILAKEALTCLQRSVGALSPACKAAVAATMHGPSIAARPVNAPAAALAPAAIPPAPPPAPAPAVTP